MQRRDMLRGSVALAATVSLRPRSGLAQPATTGVHRLKVGAVAITVLSDGSMELPTSQFLPGRDAAAIAEAFQKQGRTFAGLRAEVNVAVLEIGNEVILIDTGGGTEFMPTLGKLSERMDAAGFKPEAITRVVFTHAHPDHLWGTADPLGEETLFVNAEHLMTVAERDYWLQEDVTTLVAEQFRGMAAGTHRRLKALAERLHTTNAGVEIVSGVQLVDTSGHTPGHVSVLVHSGSEQLLIGGDVLVHDVISFTEPGWQWGTDMDAEKAAASRRRTLDQLAAEHTRLLGYHLPWPGLGHVERHGRAYRFVAA